MTPLAIGLIGCGFMGRAHAHAYRTVNRFFDVGYRPVLRAVCGRDRARADAFATRWGFESVETDWRRLVDARDENAAADARGWKAAGRQPTARSVTRRNTARGNNMVFVVGQRTE